MFDEMHTACFIGIVSCFQIIGKEEELHNAKEDQKFDPYEQPKFFPDFHLPEAIDIKKDNISDDIGDLHDIALCLCRCVV
jgi:hypothetical protein